MRSKCYRRSKRTSSITKSSEVSSQNVVHRLRKQKIGAEWRVSPALRAALNICASQLALSHPLTQQWQGCITTYSNLMILSMKPIAEQQKALEQWSSGTSSQIPC